MATWATVAAAALEGFRMYTSYLENDDGSFDSPFKPAAPARVPDVRAVHADPIPSTTVDDATFDGAGAGVSGANAVPSVPVGSSNDATVPMPRTLPVHAVVRFDDADALFPAALACLAVPLACLLAAFFPETVRPGRSHPQAPSEVRPKERPERASGTGCWTAAWIRPRCWTSRSSWRWRRGRAR